MLTGGGPPQDLQFTEVEEATLQFISPRGCSGMPLEDSEEPAMSKYSLLINVFVIFFVVVIFTSARK